MFATLLVPFFNILRRWMIYMGWTQSYRFNMTLLVPPEEDVCILKFSGESARNAPNFILPNSFLKSGSRLSSSVVAVEVNMAPLSSYRVFRVCANCLNCSLFRSSVWVLPYNLTLMSADLLFCGTGFVNVIECTLPLSSFTRLPAVADTRLTEPL